MSVRRMGEINQQTASGNQQRLCAWLSSQGGKGMGKSRAVRVLMLVTALVASCAAYVAYFSQGL